MNINIPGVEDLSPQEQQDLLNGPALKVPDGLESRFGDPSHKSPGIVALISISLVLCTFFAATRIYARVIVVKTPSLPDVLTIIAYGLLVGFTYTYYRIALDVGFFVHQWDLRLSELQVYLRFFIIGVNLYCPLVSIIKAAVLLDWIRIFVPKGTRSAFFWICHVVLWINIAFYLACLVLANLVCRPFEHIWNKMLEGKCSDGRAADIVSAGFNLGVDIIVLILPQMVIWKLQLMKDKKLGIAVIFAIGLVAVVASAVRLAMMIQYYGDHDATYSGSSFLIWTLVELVCIFLVLCVPSAPKVFKNTKLWQYASSTLRSLLSPTSRQGRSSHSGQPRLASTSGTNDGVAGSYHKIKGNNMSLQAIGSAHDSPAASVYNSQQQPHGNYKAQPKN